MANSLSDNSLASLVSMVGSANRDGGNASATGTTSSKQNRLKNSVNQTTSRKAGFSGFLNSFLANDGTGKSAGTSGKSKTGKGAGKSAKSAFNPHNNHSGKGLGGMSAADRQSLKNSIDKTVANQDSAAEAAAAAEAAEGEEEAVKAAAREAAQLIWDLLYGAGLEGGYAAAYGEGGEGLPAGWESLLGTDGTEESASALPWDSLNSPASLVPEGMEQAENALPAAGSSLPLNSQSALGTEAMQDAVATSNASAEMNIAGVLANLAELLDGMPRNHLEEALAETQPDWESGSGKELFEKIAAALDTEVVSVNEVGGRDLLALLSGGKAQNLPAGENIAGENDGSAELMQDWESFLKDYFAASADNTQENPGEIDSVSAEKVLSSLTSDELEALAPEFAKWLQESGKVNNAKDLSANLTKLAEALAAGLRRAGEGNAAATGSASPKNFQDIIARLESGLHINNTSKGASENTAPISLTAVQNENGRRLAAAISGAKNLQLNEGELHHPANQHHGLSPHMQDQLIGKSPAAAANAGANLSSMLDQIENIERLTEAMKMSSRNGIKNLTLELSPAELGKVMLRVEAKDGVVSAYLRVEKPEAAAQLQHDLATLRENLKAQGIELATVDIQQRGQNEALGDFSGQRQNRDYHQRRGERPTSGKGGKETSRESISPTSLRTADGALNFLA